MRARVVNMMVMSSALQTVRGTATEVELTMAFPSVRGLITGLNVADTVCARCRL